MASQFRFSIRSIALVALALAVALSYGIVEGDRDWSLVCQVFAAILFAAVLLQRKASPADPDAQFAQWLGYVFAVVTLSVTAIGLFMRRGFFGEWSEYAPDWDIPAMEVITPTLLWRLCLLVIAWLALPGGAANSRRLIGYLVAIVACVAVWLQLIGDSTLYGLVAIAVEGVRWAEPSKFLDEDIWFPRHRRRLICAFVILVPLFLVLASTIAIVCRAQWSTWTAKSRKVWWLAFGSFILGLAAYDLWWHMHMYPRMFPEFAEVPLHLASREAIGGMCMAVLACFWLAVGMIRRPMQNTGTLAVEGNRMAMSVAGVAALTGAMLFIGLIVFGIISQFGASPEILAYVAKDGGIMMQFALVLICAKGLWRMFVAKPKGHSNWQVRPADFWEAFGALLLLFALGIPAIAHVGICFWTAPFH